MSSVLPGARRKGQLGIGIFTEDEYLKYKEKVPPTLKDVDLSLDGYSALGLPENVPPEKEKEWVDKFPVTYHDPCNKARKGGMVDEPRRVLTKVVPEEYICWMKPDGFYNYCCGGGSGFAIMHPYNFDEWKMRISSYYKLRQILEAFRDWLYKDIPKYIAVPCSNCKGEFRDLIAYYGLWDKYKITYGGLVELLVNAIVDIPPFLELEFH